MSLRQNFWGLMKDFIKRFAKEMIEAENVEAIVIAAVNQGC